MLYAAIVFLPLIGAIIAGLFGRVIGDRGAQWVTCGAMVLSGFCAIIALFAVTSPLPSDKAAREQASAGPSDPRKMRWM